MSLSDWLTLLGFVFTVVVTVLGSTWYLATRLQGLKLTGDYMRKELADHALDDDKRDEHNLRRFDEIFTQQRELAKQNFWMLANVTGTKNRQGKATVQVPKTFTEEN